MWGGAMHAAADGRKGGVVGDEFMSLVREVQFRARFVVDSVLGVGGCPWCPGESMREVSLHAKVGWGERAARPQRDWRLVTRDHEMVRAREPALNELTPEAEA